MAGYVFVSYSRDDSAYAYALVAYLRAHGLTVWVDHELSYGDRWLEEIRAKVDQCAVLVPVMTASAEASPWVGREITRADGRSKPIMPVLLSGEVFFRLSDVQYEDVRGGQMPGPGFVEKLRRLVDPAGVPPVTSAIPMPQSGVPLSGGPLSGVPLVPPPPKPPWWRRRLTAIGALALAVVLAVTAVVIAANVGGPPTATPTTPPAPTPSDGPFDVAGSVGPATPIAGATKGGTITVLAPPFDHLDPARNYINTSQVIASLLTRSLTTFKEIRRPDGTVSSRVVGDLATNPGIDVHHDCKVWQYTLKTGLKYENGTPVTANDVAYGIARSFSPDLTGGPHYIQNWLTGNSAASSDFNSQYQGPYTGSDMPPGVSVAGNTITFTFPKPHCDLPYAAAMPMTAAVPSASDTRLQYDAHPISDGPYRIATYQPGVMLRLQRNPYWDAALDPVRNAYPDQLLFTFGLGSDLIDTKLMADASADQASVSWVNVNAAAAVQITGSTKARIVDGTSQFVDYLYINTQRVTDQSVRAALNTGLDKTAVLATLGGPVTGTVLNTIESPATPGWQNYNVFGVPATGDVIKAKSLLAGKTPALTMCYIDDPLFKSEATAIQTSLAKSGFKITLRSIKIDTYVAMIGDRANTCDLYRNGWGFDWPSGSTIIPTLLDGRSITDHNNQNVSYYNNPATNAEIDRISSESDQAQAAADWATLDEKIMAEDAPLVPLYVNRYYALTGSDVGGAFLSNAWGVTSLSSLYVKRA